MSPYLVIAGVVSAGLALLKLVSSKSSSSAANYTAQNSGGTMPFIQARYYSPANRTKIDQIVIHTMEAHERNDTAENVARWFASKDSPQASTHYCIDNDSVVQCVHDHDIAWHASQANPTSIGLEHAGFARQTADEWRDEYSQAVLKNSARLAAQLCRAYNIPIVRLNPAQVRNGERGFCGHVDVNVGYGNHGGHTDPGLSFPWDDYLRMVDHELTS
jgi:N-acetyl-anhydromuramyl-L-alanine amidase AmpD